MKLFLLLLVLGQSKDGGTSFDKSAATVAVTGWTATVTNRTAVPWVKPVFWVNGKWGASVPELAPGAFVQLTAKNLIDREGRPAPADLPYVSIEVRANGMKFFPVAP
jgi:hypothetical protein